MRLHLLEHDPIDMSCTNMTRWAKERGHTVQHTYLCSNETLPDMDNFDWVMIMGGSPHAWEGEKHPWLALEKAFISDALERDKFILGVCFGAQLLAEALGGAVTPNRHREIGWHEVAVTTEGRDGFLFRNIQKRFMTFHWHSDHFSIPHGCIRLASSETTPNQAFIMEGKPVVGFQFHPEYSREMVTRFAHDSGHEWYPGPFVPGKDAILEQTRAMPDTYWLMAALLDNLANEFL